MIRHRLSTYLLLRRANRKLRAIEAEREARAHLNRPHVQSAHMVGYFIAPPTPTARSMGVTPRYVAGIAAFAFAVVALNTYFPQSSQSPVFACAQLARN